MTSVGARLNRADTTLRYTTFFFYLFTFFDVFIVIFSWRAMGDLKKNESNIWCCNSVFSYIWKRNTCELFRLTWSLFLESPETFRVYFGCLTFLYIIATSRFWASKLRNPLVFSYLKNMLKDQLFKTSKLKPRVLGSFEIQALCALLLSENLQGKINRICVTPLDIGAWLCSSIPSLIENHYLIWRKG